MQKGQVSFDLILAILMVLLVLTMLGIYIKVLEKNTSALMERSQAKALLLEAYSAAATIKAYDKESHSPSLPAGMALDTNIGIKIVKSNSYYPCSVTFNTTTPAQSTITATVGATSQSYTQLDLTGMTISPLTVNCGNQVRIS